MIRIMLALRPKNDETLEQIKDLIENLFKCNMEQRFSSNYVDEYYYLAKIIESDINIQLCHSDDDYSNEWPYWVFLKSSDSLTFSNFVKNFLNLMKSKYDIMRVVYCVSTNQEKRIILVKDKNILLNFETDDA
jgi:hypothetical protein